MVGSLVGGRYRIVKKLGEGGMGAVFLAVQEPLGREVAVKVMRSDYAADATIAERFAREAAALARLTHPHVVSIVDFGVDGEVLFLVMELLKGETLRDRLRARGRLAPAEATAVARDIAAGLAGVHEMNVVHRDLKPDNIMLVPSGQSRSLAKILDFGVARMSGTASLTKTGIAMGTPGYIAPELALHGVRDDPRLDLYALGVIWFEMLTGTSPFTAETPLELIMKHASLRAPRPSERVDGVPPEIDGLVVDLMAKAPEDRPKSAANLLAKIDALGRGVVSTAPFAIEEPAAGAPTAPSLAPEWPTEAMERPAPSPPPTVRRGRVAAAGAAVVVVAIAVAAAVVAARASDDDAAASIASPAAARPAEAPPPVAARPAEAPRPEDTAADDGDAAVQAVAHGDDTPGDAPSTGGRARAGRGDDARRPAAMSKPKSRRKPFVPDLGAPAAVERDLGAPAAVERAPAPIVPELAP